MNGSFLQGKMHCPDEWWDCLGTFWEKVRCIIKGVLDQPVKSFVSRPAQVPTPHSALTSHLLTCPPLPSLVTSPPPLQYPTRQWPQQGEKRGRRGEPLSGKEEYPQPTSHRILAQM